MTTETAKSPHWGQSTKLVVAIVMLVIVAALLVRFNNIIGPLLLAFILSYLLHPLASRVSRRSQLSWRGSVNLIFLIFLLLITLFLTIAGFAVVDQLRSLTRVVENFVTDLPQLARDLSTQVYHIGPFEFDFAQLEDQLLVPLGVDFATLGQQTLNAVQPLLGSAGSILGALATSALGTLAWGAFILIISFFILAESGQVGNNFQGLERTGHSEDLRIMTRRLGAIWNAFLRGQLLLFVLIVASNFTVMTILGVRNALGLAFLAGLAKFIPYVGPLVSGIITALVALFQDGNYLGIQPPLTYAIVVVVAAIVLDQIFDNLITPRIYGSTLGVHPAAVLVSAIIALNLLGFLGLLLAAPVLASLQLFTTYALRKMLDLDPWEAPGPEGEPVPNPWASLRRQIGDFGRKIWQRIKTFIESRRKQ